MGIPADMILKRYSVHEIYQIMASPPKEFKVSLTSKQIKDRIKISKTMVARAKKCNRDLNRRDRLWLWNDARAAACLGPDSIARQCSMDDYLWMYWCLAIGAGKRLGLGQVEHILEIKSVFAQFFCKDVSGVRDANACLLSPISAAPNGTTGHRNFEQVFQYLSSCIR